VPPLLADPLFTKLPSSVTAKPSFHSHLTGPSLSFKSVSFSSRFCTPHLISDRWRFASWPLVENCSPPLFSVPFLINAARAGFLAVPERLEKAARSLGASPWRVFFTISLPMAWRDILSGMVLMWARGISEFGAVIIIAYHPMTTPVMVFQRFNDYGLAHARSVAVLLIIICVAIFVVVRFLARRPTPEAQNA